MANLLQYNSVTVQKMMDQLDVVKYNPSAIQYTIMNLLDEISSNSIQIVDPTSPFPFLLEASCVNTALAINENLIGLRKQYPSLAVTTEDIYTHMSDADFINIYGKPASTVFTLTVQVTDLTSGLVLDPSDGSYRATIPRDTYFTVGNVLVFTMEYPIDIRRFSNGVVQISYDATITNPLSNLTTNIIPYTVRVDPQNGQWVFFDIPVNQFQITTTAIPVQPSSVFSKNIQFNDSFYFIRVFYSSGSGGVWTEIGITHTSEVFDPLNPTAIISVYSGTLNVLIPTIYFTNGMITGVVRVDVYTTKGAISMNLSNYSMSSFSATLRTMDPGRDATPFTLAMDGLSFYAYSDKTVSGGSSALDFPTLRAQVINNSVGDRQLPITNTQITAYVSAAGFSLVKNVDVVTNRIFLATNKLPQPSNANLLTPANIGISSVTVNLSQLATLDSISNNGTRITILPNTLAISENGLIRFLSNSETNTILSLSKPQMVAAVNSASYMYTPFHCVLDSSASEFSMRVYDLLFPTASILSFILQNQTLKLPVNTGTYLLAKTLSGYTLTIQTTSSNAYRLLPIGQVAVQLGFYPVGEVNMAYINGTLSNPNNINTTIERVFTFNIQTSHDIDSNDVLYITNALMGNANNGIVVGVSLSHSFNIFYTTNSIVQGYVASQADSLINLNMLPARSACITQESLLLKFGTSLRNLWSRSRTFVGSTVYQTYTVDIPDVYSEDIYSTDPATGSIFSYDSTGDLVYNLLHKAGDPVLDSRGSPIYLHKAGDVVLDSNGVPVANVALSTDQEIDILFIDGKYFFTTSPLYTGYQLEVAGVLDAWITTDIASIQQQLLEKTVIYFYPQTTLGLVNVYPEDGSLVPILAMQSIVVNLYVPDITFKDLVLRNNLINATIQTIDSYITAPIVNISKITTALAAVYGGSVSSVSVSGLGGSKNYSIVTLAEEHNTMCLNKLLVIESDGSLGVLEDVSVNFFNLG